MFVGSLNQTLLEEGSSEFTFERAESVACEEQLARVERHLEGKHGGSCFHFLFK
jgi:hypothetical protein